MSNLPQSDWILAGRFVDGDLPEREASAAESRIKSDAEFAAAVEEIRAQSNLIGGLPKFRPSEDLADRTLQTSLDQVKAIMGVWPIESSDAVVATRKQASSESFDWKSTVALVASLAGVLMIGAMLLQNNNGSSSDIAMSPETSAQPSYKAEEGVEAVDASVLADLVLKQRKGDFFPNEKKASSIASKKTFPQQFIEGDEIPKVVAPEIGAFSGTPAIRSAKSSEVAKSSAPVDQIWCVRQDSSASRNAVCDILTSNAIQVQRDVQQSTDASSAVTLGQAVEAFYVAATPKQMKQAMSQLSNSANIKMIQLPNGQDSLIADAIQQQFAQSNPAEFADPNHKAEKSDIPSSFPAASNALAQQLVLKSLPRNMSLPGPVPPILKSGSPIEGLAQTAEENSNEELAANSGAQQQQALPLPAFPKTEAVPTPSKSVAGAGMGGMGGGAKAGPPNSASQLQKPVQQYVQQAMPAQDRELGKYLDASDQQLRQYLILVSGGEE